MKNKITLFASILCGIFFYSSTQIHAQEIMSFRQDLGSSGFSKNYSISERDVDCLFNIYRQIKRNEAVIDASIREAIKSGLVIAFQENPEKTVKTLRAVKLAAPAVSILVTLLQKNKTSEERHVGVSQSMVLFLDELMVRAEAR